MSSFELIMEPKTIKAQAMAMVLLIKASEKAMSKNVERSGVKYESEPKILMSPFFHTIIPHIKSSTNWP